MQIHFSKWLNWKCVNDRSGKIPNKPGAYLIAENVKRGSAPDPTSTKIVYIGQSEKLRRRLQQFNNTARTSLGRGHAGGRTLRRRRFNDNPLECEWDDYQNDLFIAFWNSSDADSRRASEDFGNSLREYEERVSMEIRFVEARLLLDYIIQNKRYPEFNKQAHNPDLILKILDKSHTWSNLPVTN